MKIQTISNTSFESVKGFKGLSRVNKKVLGTLGLSGAFLLNRATLQKGSASTNLNYDWDFDDQHGTYMDDHQYFDRQARLQTKEGRAREVVKGMTATNGLVGLTLGSLDVTDWFSYSAVVAAMITKISDIYEVELNSKVENALTSFAKTYFTGMVLSKVTRGIPIIENLVNSASAMTLTKTIGSKLIDRFESAQKRYDREKELQAKLTKMQREIDEMKARNERINQILQEEIEKENKKNRK